MTPCGRNAGQALVIIQRLHDVKRRRPGRERNRRERDPEMNLRKRRARVVRTVPDAEGVQDRDECERADHRQSETSAPIHDAPRVFRMFLMITSLIEDPRFPQKSATVRRTPASSSWRLDANRCRSLASTRFSVATNHAFAGL